MSVFWGFDGILMGLCGACTLACARVCAYVCVCVTVGWMKIQEAAQFEL